MSRRYGSRRARTGIAGALLLAMIGVAARASTAADCERGYTPKLGQPGKDVMWLPTPAQLVARMLDAAQVEPSDVVYDLGAGDGRIVIAAAKRGARAIGVEFNPQLAALAQCLVTAAGLGARARIVQGDLFQTNLADATVVTLYLLPQLNRRLRPKLLALRPGTRIVSHAYLMDDWPPDERIETPEGLAYLWIVPAHLDGRWMFRARGGSERFPVTFIQTYQSLVGLVGDAGEPLIDATLHGSQLRFAFADGEGGRVQVAGEVDGARIEARVTRRGRSEDYLGTRSG